MRGNTNANTSGGSGNIGNESALDLLIAQNTAKANLATNLQGKGIEANATTETLNELVNKVPNILTDNSQTFPECLTLNLTVSPLYKYIRRNVIEVNGYFIFLNVSSTTNVAYLSYIKKSDIENAMIDNTSVSLSSFILNSASLSSQSIAGETQLCLTPDNNKIYLWDTTSTNHHIRAFDINWSGEDITSITEDTNVNINIAIGNYCGNLVYRDSKLLMSSATGIYLYDLTTSTKTTLKSATLPRGYYSFIIWYKSDEFIYGYIENSKLTIEVYSISGSSATLVDTIYGSTTSTASNWDDIQNKIKVVGNKVFIPMSQNNTYSGIKLAIYDLNSKTITEYTNAKTINMSLVSSEMNRYLSKVSVLHLDNRYIVETRYVFYIFDESFNLINSVNINTDVISANSSSVSNTPNFSTLFWLGDKMISFDGANVISIPYYYGKKTIIKKVNSINEQTKEMYYPADEITVADIEAGYYD